MGQQTSELWDTLWRTKNTHREYAFDIAGTWYGADEEIDHTIENGLFEDFGIGNASCAHLVLTFYSSSPVPRGAKIQRFVRLVNKERHTDWMPAGVFFTNRRTEDAGYWEVEAYDVMRKAEQPWNPDQSLKFPMPMPDAVKIFAEIMGCEIDPRTSLNPDYTIDYPATDENNEDPENNNYTIRQILQWIAAAHGGNWIITPEGKLLLVQLGSEPQETNYLVSEYGDAITFGGVRILVG